MGIFFLARFSGYTSYKTFPKLGIKPDFRRVLNLTLTFYAVAFATPFSDKLLQLLITLIAKKLYLIARIDLTRVSWYWMWYFRQKLKKNCPAQLFITT